MQEETCLWYKWSCWKPPLLVLNPVQKICVMGAGAIVTNMGRILLPLLSLDPKKQVLFRLGNATN